MPDDPLARLRANGRIKCDTAAFAVEDRLYIGFDEEDLIDGRLETERVRFPDWSCNWSKFSFPVDVRFRRNGKPTDGCYSISVSTARYKQYATPVHDPVAEPDQENYAHVEVRELFEGEDILFEPPKNRKKDNKTHKLRRLEYRQNIANHNTIELKIGEAIV